jgi:molybdate transport repressor ModE-like protein
MHISLEVRWRLGPGHGEEIDPALFELLQAVQAEGSLSRAAGTVSVSYRHAWGLVRKWESRFHAPLVHMQRGRGRGARLTVLAERLLEARGQLAQQVQPTLDAASRNLSGEIRKLGRARPIQRLRIAASHGIGVARLAELLSSRGTDVQLLTRGSIESLKLLARGECTAAGFHLPLGTLGEHVLPLYERWLRQDRFVLLLLAVRQQGLILQRSNPKRIRGLADLSRRSVRFINRQPEAGTRVILDAMLEEARIDPATIRGYRNEEFTHLAVAAIVAGGAADAAFGIEAAAAEFGLAFLPLVKEAYVLAVPGADTELVQLLERALRSTRFRKLMGDVPGYDAARSGRRLGLAELQRLA